MQWKVLVGAGGPQELDDVVGPGTIPCDQPNRQFKGSRGAFGASASRSPASCSRSFWRVSTLLPIVTVGSMAVAFSWTCPVAGHRSRVPWNETARPLRNSAGLLQGGHDRRGVLGKDHDRQGDGGAGAPRVIGQLADRCPAGAFRRSVK